MFPANTQPSWLSTPIATLTVSALVMFPANTQPSWLLTPIVTFTVSAFGHVPRQHPAKLTVNTYSDVDCQRPWSCSPLTPRCGHRSDHYIHRHKVTFSCSRWAFLGGDFFLKCKDLGGKFDESGDQLTWTSFIHYPRISPQWLSQHFPATCIWAHFPDRFQHHMDSTVSSFCLHCIKGVCIHIFTCNLLPSILAGWLGSLHATTVTLGWNRH